jgi:serine/threonine protein kinase
MAVAAGAKLGPYEILAPIGAGGMGEVYRARDTKLKRDVALKVLPETFARDPDRMARFQREAEVLASLNHPNIAQIYGVEDRALVMELVEGESPKGPMPFDEAWHIASQIAAALEYAHDKGIVHRDLKPANVKVTPEGVVKLLDFGLAKAFAGQGEAPADAENSPTITCGGTEVGVILGTAAYMSPEQASGKRVDKRVDIWSFGVVLWEMLTGKRLFESGETMSHTLADVLRADIDFNKLPATTPAPIRELVRRCLTRDVRNRLRDIGEARIVLENPLCNEPVPATPIADRLHTRAPWGTALLFALAFAAIAFVHFRQQSPAEHVLRYTIAPPENSAVHSFAISPDGRYLALAAVVKGKRQLWLRAMDELQFRPMPDTEGATLPFWSPDSRYLGFFAQLKLKKIAVSGGPAQSLCNAGIGSGGTWNSEGVILFSTAGLLGSLQWIPSAGGTPTDVRKVKEAYAYPAFLAGSRHFLYSLSYAAPGMRGIYLSSLDGGEPRRILADSSSALFASSAGSRTGHLLFRRQNTLMAQPFAATSGQFRGEAFPIAEEVNPLTGNTLMPATVSGTGTLVYASGSASSGSQIVWYDRAGKVLSLVGAPGAVFTPAISPDERSVAYSRSTGPGTADIWLRDSRGIETRLTADPSGNYVPLWSPTGDRIVWDSNRRGSLDLYQKPTSGSGQDEALLPPITTALPVTSNRSADQWSRDGRFIVYSEVASNGKQDLWVLPLGSGDRKPTPFLKTEFDELHGQLSPDSAWMAYASDETGQREVYVRAFPSGEGVRRISIAGGDQPRWRRDGKELFFAGADGRMMVVPIKAVTGPKPSFEPGPPVPLFESHVINTPSTSGVFQYDVTRDGKRFLVVTDNLAAANSPLTVVVNWYAGLKR